MSLPFHCFVSPSLSLSIALLIRAKSILDALIGGIFNIFLYKDRSVVDEINQENKSQMLD